ncbi:hypothetical protein IC575_021917 [Cucumis melo]
MPLMGTALVVLAGLISALKVVGGSLFDHRFSFLGAGEDFAGGSIVRMILLGLLHMGLIGV